MKKNFQIIKWISLIVFALAFADNQDWIKVPQIFYPYDMYMMLGASVAAFLIGNQLRWLGIIIVAIGYALHMGWISFNFDQVSFRPVWVMLGGYITLFLNTR
ncbi:MAG: hypothetical protein AAFU64_07110 [Bacteroidota bacterium]